MSHYLTVPKTARYEIIGSIEQAKIIVFALHGYGQLAPYFIRKFEGLDEKIALVVPEGLHRFYLSGSNGRVGASWMTKEDRENDIQDNLNYLNALYTHLRINNEKSRIVLLGFSQGGATAARWFTESPQLFHKLIMWASIFPPDISFPLKLEDTQSHFFVVGDQDEYFDSLEAESVCDFYKAHGFKCLRYSGGHNIDTNLLKGILNQI